MESELKLQKAHVLALPYPSQGHINPMHQFCKRLVSKGLKSTLAVTNYIFKTNSPKSNTVQIDTISDGFDEGGFMEADSIQDYLAKLEIVGRKSLAQIIKQYQKTDTPIDCLVYDSFLPWALDVGKEYGIITASFFTQPCAVNLVYYHVHHGILEIPVASFPVTISGLPLLDRLDMPSFIALENSYPAYFRLVLNQFLNNEKADLELVNTFYFLEKEAVESMSKFSRLLTIGPTIPSFYLDNRIENDKQYELDLFDSDQSISIAWLKDKPISSVVYISFGSMACLGEKQMEEIAWALNQTNFYFLWVVRASEESKIPTDFMQQVSKKGTDTNSSVDNRMTDSVRVSEKGLLVRWSPQVKVMSNESIGCFFSHCGWNSTIEALSVGIPMVGMPQWTDQTMNAKLVQDVWKIGLRTKVNEDGLVSREEIENCIREVMERERGKELKENAMKWKKLAKEAVCDGGTSDKCIDEFVSSLERIN